MPVCAAGSRTEPPVSVPRATGPRSGGDGRCRTSRRTADDALGVHRVPGRAPEPARGGGTHAELVEVRRAENHRAGAPEAFHHGGVVGCPIGAEEGGSGRRWQPADGDVVLHGDRESEERSPGVRRLPLEPPGGCRGALPVEMQEGVDAPVDLFGAVERGRGRPCDVGVPGRKREPGGVLPGRRHVPPPSTRGTWTKRSPRSGASSNALPSGNPSRGSSGRSGQAASSPEGPPGCASGSLLAVSHDPRRVGPEHLAGGEKVPCPRLSLGRRDRRQGGDAEELVALDAVRHPVPPMIQCGREYSRGGAASRRYLQCPESRGRPAPGRDLRVRGRPARGL